MMLQSGSNDKKYTWDNKWIHPYESVWSIFEKFKAANVLPATSLNKIVTLASGRGSAAKLHYDKFKYIYHYSSLVSNYQMPDTLQYNLSIFGNIELVLSQRLRYCPICIKQSYHSVFHQLTFLDKCFIHKNTNLEYMCDCNLSYVMKSKSDEVKAFQCECGKHLPVPNTLDGIMKLWGKTIKEPIITRPNDLKSIKIIDFNNFKNRHLFLSELSENNKKVLWDYFYTGKSNIKPSLYDNKKTEYKNELLAAEYIFNKVIKLHGIEKFKEHYFIMKRSYSYDIDGYDVDLLASIYLIYELLSYTYIDQIYPVKVEYGILKKDYIFNDYIEFIYRTFDHRGNISYNANNTEYYIYKRLLKERYNQLKKCFLSNNKHDFPRSGSKMRYEKTFPVFILVEDTKGNILLYD